MDEPVITAPEGVEIGFRVYLRSDSSELVAVIALDGMTRMREFNDVDVEGLIKSLGKPDYLLLDRLAGDDPQGDHRLPQGEGAVTRDPEERIDELLRTTTEYLEGWRGEKKKTARLSATLIQALNDNVWYAYFTGSVHDGSWWDAGMSDAEWLERELGLPMHVRHPVRT